MTPPGLTCTRCRGQLYPHTAKRTEDGYTHAHRCPRMCSVEGCDQRHHANGYCQPHNRRWVQYGDPCHASPLVNADERLEDCRWMADTGEHLAGAAQRLGLNVKALEKWLRTHDRDCLARLMSREPRDHNRVLDGISISELTGKRERRRRLREVAA